MSGGPTGREHRPLPPKGPGRKVRIPWSRWARQPGWQWGGRVFRVPTGIPGPQPAVLTHSAPLLPPGHYHVDVAGTWSVSQTVRFALSSQRAQGHSRDCPACPLLLHIRDWPTAHVRGLRPWAQPTVTTRRAQLACSGPPGSGAALTISSPSRKVAENFRTCLEPVRSGVPVKSSAWWPLEKKGEFWGRPPWARP